MKVLFVNDNEPSTNIGCRATAHSFRKIISDNGFKLESQIYIDELRQGIPHGAINNKSQLTLGLSRLDDINYSHTQIKPKAIYKNINKLLSPTPTDGREIKQLAERWGLEILPKKHKSALKRSDIMVVNGEGSFYKNRSHARMMLYYAYLATRLPDTKCIFSNLTISLDKRFISSGLKSMALFVLPKVDKVIFREPHSYAEYTSQISKDNCTLAADVAFASEKERYQKLTQDSLFQLLDFWNNINPTTQSIGEFVCIGGNSIYPVSETASPPTDQYIELINEFETSYSIIIVPSKEADEEYLRDVAEETSTPMVSSKNSLGLLRRLLGEASVYIGGRYHPAVFALSGGTPIICFSTKQNKNKGLIEHSGINSKVYDAYRFADYKCDIRDLANGLGDEYPNKQLDERVTELGKLAYKNCPPTV